MKYVAKAIEVEAIQFDGTHSCGVEIQKLLPNLRVELVYNYGGHPGYKLQVLISNRFFDVWPSNYIVVGPRGQISILTQEIFEEMYEKFFSEP